MNAYGSTDEGVSFYVDFAGITLFHAGDLNLWHWRDESSVTEIESAERAFYDCVAPIPKQKIDVAFFPVDPRQGSMYDAGAGYFIMTVKPRFFIPMHFQGRPDVALRFAVTGETPQTRIVALEQPGDHIDLHLPEDEASRAGSEAEGFIEGRRKFLISNAPTQKQGCQANDTDISKSKTKFFARRFPKGERKALWWGDGQSPIFT